ncbi:MAG: transcriptional repressor [Clostridia bacterium]
MRYSIQRQTVLDYLQSTTKHPDAYTVYARVKERLPNISLGTVYRNLTELVEAGDARRIATDTQTDRFDADTSAHAHFVCKNCNNVTDVFGINIDYKGENEVDSAEVIFYGICKDCINNKEEKK